MKNNKLYESLITSKIRDTLQQLEKEKQQQTGIDLQNTIRNIIKTHKARPSLEDAKVYVEIMKEEYPLFMCMTDYDIIRLAKTELDVDLSFKLLSFIIPEHRPNPYYEIITL